MPSFVVTDQMEFDRRRQTCSAARVQFLAEASKTELALEQLAITVSPETARQFAEQLLAETSAYEEYQLAAVRLRDFLQEHLYRVH